MRNFLNKYWAIILLTILSGLVVWPIFIPGYFSHHDDLQVIRVFEMRKCMVDLQIPCRWVPDMGYGNGFPLFNYYGVFPYYLGALFSFVLGYIGAAKILFFIPLVMGGISMYLLSKELFGKLGGVASGILFLFAPYRALDTYVRGAVAESFAISLIPFVFYFSLILVKKGTLKGFLGATLFLAAFLITHNIMTLIFTPVLVVWLFFWLFVERFKNFKLVFLSVIIGFGLSAFFLVPAFFERNLVQTENLTQNALDYRNHFISVSRLFWDHSWGYLGATKSIESNLSFQIGWPHLFFVVVAPFYLLVFYFRKKKRQVSQKNLILVIIMTTLFWLSAFMTHNKSAFLWEKIKILSYTQFPWRFLSLSIFCASLVGGFLTSLINVKWRLIFLLFVLVITVGLNWRYFRPEIFYPTLTDQEKLSGELWTLQQGGAILDYLPKTALEPREPAPTSPIVVSGDAMVSDFINKSNLWNFKVSVLKDAVIEVPVFDFPKWQVLVNGKSYSYSNKNYLGRISILLSIGNYEINGRFQNTPIRTLANSMSMVSLIVIFYIAIYGKNRKIFSKV